MGVSSCLHAHNSQIVYLLKEIASKISRAVPWKSTEQMWSLRKISYFYSTEIAPNVSVTLATKCCTLYLVFYTYLFNPLWTKFFFSSFCWPKMVSSRLQTHRRDAHRKFFRWSLLKIELKFLWNGTPVSSWALKVNLLIFNGIETQLLLDFEFFQCNKI